MPTAGVPSDNTTLVEVLDRLAGEGYTSDFLIRDGPSVVCGRCRHRIPAHELELDQLRRLEGASDPADMAAVLALTCPDCGTLGTAVVRFGPEASAEEAQVLRLLDDHRDEPTDDT